MSEFSIRETLNWQAWDEFNRQSPQGSLFSNSSYLQAMGKPFQCFLVYKGGQPKAGFIVTANVQQPEIVELDDLVIYGGILFVADKDSNTSKRHAQQFQVTEAIVKFLTDHYHRVEMAMTPQFQDLRPFLWHQYHHPDPRQRFIADLRYTAYLNIEELAGPEPEQSKVFANLSELRRRNIREGQKNNAELRLEQHIGRFIDFYRALMLAQGERVDPDKLDRMAALINELLIQDHALMSACYDSAGTLLYLTVFGWDERRAYYLFGAGNPELQTRYQGSFCFWETFKLLAGERGIKQVDLEGVNSPQRGQFKMSFGGELVPYYHLFYCANGNKRLNN